MSPRANVRSLDAIRQFRPSVVRFEDDVMAALTGLRTELNRTMQWLDHDCPAHWQNQIRLGFDHVNEARTQLSRKQMMTIGGRHPDCIEEKKALVRSKQQLETAQEKLKLCRQWSIKAAPRRRRIPVAARTGRAGNFAGDPEDDGDPRADRDRPGTIQRDRSPVAVGASRVRYHDRVAGKVGSGRHRRTDVLRRTGREPRARKI